MRHLLIMGFLFAFNVSCKLRYDSELKDEGITRVSEVSISEVTSKLKKLYKLSEGDTNALRKLLPKIVQATFKIDCDGGHASGVFIGPQGQFVTGGHVIAEDIGSCIIYTHEPDSENPDVFVLKEINSRVIVSEAIDDNYTWDLARGTVVNARPHTFFSIPNVQNKLNKNLLITMGFPSETFRDGTQSEAFKNDFSKMLAKSCQKNLDTYHGLIKTYKELLAMPGFTSEEKTRYKGYESQLKIYINRFTAGCTYMQSSESKLNLKEGYDISDGKSAYLSLGHSYYIDQGFILTNLDTIPGMSGGPLIDLKTGELLGVLNGSLAGMTYMKSISYRADAVFSSVYKDRLAQLAKDHRVEKPACECNLNVYQDDSDTADTKVFESPYFMCLSSNDLESKCQRLSGSKRNSIRVTDKGLNLYATFNNCQRVKVGSTSCAFYGGSLVRVLGDNGKDRVVEIKPDLAKYWYEFEPPE